MDLTQEECKKLWVYSDGRLFRINNNNKVRANKYYTLSGKSRKKVKYKNKAYATSRIIYILHKGKIPDGLVIDHIDHNPRNNRIENLRAVSFKDNLKNRKLSKTNKTTTFNGVCIHNQVLKKAGKTYTYTRFRAYIGVNQKRIYLGYFKTLDEAITARKQANIKYGFHENHGLETVDNKVQVG